MGDLISSISEASINIDANVGYDIAFPHLGLFFKNFRNVIYIPMPGGHYLRIAYYGIIVALAMLISFFVVARLAKSTRQNEENYIDLFIYIIICGVFGARLYYVLFNLPYYASQPSKIFAINEGGLAIYGGIISAFIVTFIFCKKRKLKISDIFDTAIIGLPLGQAIGRFGNFFNMEAFGTYTDNIFAMSMRYELVDYNYIDDNIYMHKIIEDGIEYVQAHPTFLYESFFNIILFIILIVLYKKCKKFGFMIFATYLLGYGIIRFFIESLRTDSLMLFNTGVRVSQAVAIISIIVGLIIYIINIKNMLFTNKDKEVKI